MTKQPIVRRQNTPMRELEEMLDDFRRHFGSFMYSPFSSWGTRLVPSPLLEEIRTPLCDMIDRGDRYELHVEVPGIDKEKIDVKALKNAVEISAKQSEKTEEKRGNYVYNERARRSFYRRIATPEEIIPSKINAKMVNGILNIELPKRKPAKEQHTKVAVK